MPTNNFFQLDKKYYQSRFDKAALSYQQTAVAQQEVGQRMLERLDYIRINPTILLDIGTATGDITRLLLKKFPKTQLIALDISCAMLTKAKRQKPWRSKLHPVCADADYLPVADNSCDLIFSNLTLHWCNDFDRVLLDCWRILKPQGLLLFSTYGPDTLMELRQCWRKIDQQPHIHTFFDMHDIGDALLRAQFQDPVMDTERFTLIYSQPKALLQDLRNLGAVNAIRNRARGLTGKAKYRALINNYESLRNQEGLIPATLEVVHGHAWKPFQVERYTVSSQNNIAAFPLSQLKQR